VLNRSERLAGPRQPHYPDRNAIRLSLVNFAAVIADIQCQSQPLSPGKGVQVDINYLVHLGPQALPAIDRAIQLRGADPNLFPDVIACRTATVRTWLPGVPGVFGAGGSQHTLDAQQAEFGAS